MINIQQTFHQLKKEKVVRTCGIIIILLTSFVAIYFSAIAALIIVGNYILGFIVCWALLKYQSKASFCLQRLVSFYRNNGNGIKTDVSNRKGLEKTPWKDIYVDKQLNNALEQFYDRILQTFVTSWYGNFTNDTMFINELRYCLRFATASVVRKAFEIDTGEVIANKLAPCVIKHVDDYMYMKQIASIKKASVDNIAVEYLGTRLHVAASNRKNELSYLQSLVSCLLPKLLPEEYLKCKNYNVLIREILAGWVFLPMMDVLADPNIINSLIILICTYKSKGSGGIKRSESVELLINFNNRITNSSTFTCDLKTVKKDANLLNAFTQYLNRENSSHIMQFCLDVDEFNNKLLTPDLSRSQLENLHKEATKLFKEYFTTTSANFINCPPDIVNNFNDLLQEGVYNVAKLRTSEPLYQTYELAMNNLENDLLPQFFHSNEFYQHICGSKVTATFNKASVNKSPTHSPGSPFKLRGRKYYEPVSQSTVSKISSGLGRIKGALRSNQPIEGAIYPGDAQGLENGTIEDIIISDCSNIFRDLRTWHVSIPTADMVQVSGKITVVYNVNVQRLEAITESEKKQWTVKRRDQDFYTLKVKLIEFHGETVIANAPFPTRRSSMPVETRRKKYEEFLTKLLQKPALRGSDLLYSFLTCEQEFTMFVAASETNVGDIGNIYQSVAYMLRKEKGQYLDAFMATYLSSTLKAKQGKPEWAEIGDEVDALVMHETQRSCLPKTFASNTFKDNFGVPYSSVKQSTSSPFTPNNVTESIFYLLRHIFNVPSGILRLYAAVCTVGQHAVESTFRFYVDYKIRSGLSHSNLAYLVELLEGVIFNKHLSITKEELEARKLRAFKELDRLLPGLVAKILGDDFRIGMTNLLEMLQNPFLNKQLVYNLMDLIISEMYPQLDVCDK